MRNLIAFMTFLLAAGLAQAQTAPAVTDARGTKVNLDAHASAEVDNDVMRASLFVEMEDTDATRLADKVNRATNDSLKLAREFTGVRAKTSAYTTHPVIDKEKIARWRSRSEISVEGEDFRRMSEAIGKLQAIMKVGAVEFSVRRPHAPRPGRRSPRLPSRSFCARRNRSQRVSRGPGSTCWKQRCLPMAAPFPRGRC